MKPIIIIGSGLAGYTLAKEIRKLDKSTPVQLITADDGTFYSKPMLSNALSKQQNIEKLAMYPAGVIASQQNIQVLTHTRIEKVDTDKNNVISNQGEHSYSKLVFATGATPVRIQVLGNAADDMLSVNSLDDYAIFRKKLENKKHVTILGAGLIGCEFANDLAASGYKVSIIDLADRPLGRLLPEQAAINLKNKLSELDISWYLKQSLKSLDKNDNSYQLTLDDDTIFETDLVLSAIGLKSNTEIAVSAGFDTNRGIIVNDYLQTSEENIFALGDCAEINGNVLPFVMPIMLGARSLAQTLTGSKTEVVYPAMPVAVKTPAHPVVVCPPPMNHNGNWQEEVFGTGIKSVCYDKGKITGFALTGDAIEEKQSLVKLM